MASQIPFVNSTNDLKLLEQLFSDSPIVRVSLTNPEIWKSLPKKQRVWVDGGVDALETWPPKQDNVKEVLEDFENCSQIADSSFQAKPDRRKISAFVAGVLDACAAKHPVWTSVPQLPMVSGNHRNKINRLLAESSAEWRVKKRYDKKLVLPVVLTHQDQTKYKQYRANIVKLAAEGVTLSGADEVWIVDSSLDDLSGSDTLGRTRFPKIAELHSEVLAAISKDVFIVGGPYWGLNLILWARGLATYPAIGLGKGFQYHVPGGVFRAPKAKVAIAHLRRLPVVSRELEEWLNQAAARAKANHKARSEFEELARHIQQYSDIEKARSQVARVYKEWLDEIESVPEGGRALALYQDLSDAFVLGRFIGKPLPRSESPGRAPEKVAQQLLINCL